MHYLKTYPDSIGISHYLCWRMKSMPAEEVEFYWPQIWWVIVAIPSFPSYHAGTMPALLLVVWMMGLEETRLTLSHLLITYPTSSNALESFILQRAEESTHSAMLVSPVRLERSN
jgi:hypothetical protein